MSKNTDLSSLINYVKGASTGQLNAPSYTSATSFTGTIAGYLGFDSSGNILTTGSASQWVTSGSNIYYNTGNVMIGTTTAFARLTIDGGSGTSTASTLMLNQGAGGTSFAQINGCGDASHGLVLRGAPSNGTTNNFLVTPGDIMSFYEYGGDFRFYKKNGSLTLQMQIHQFGAVRIGKLAYTDAIFRSLYIGGRPYDNGYSIINMNPITTDFNGGYDIGVFENGTSGSQYFWIGDNRNGERMRIGANGNVGIGTTDITTYTAAPLNILAQSNFAIRLIGASSTNRSLIMFFPNSGLGAGYATIGCDNTSFYISASNTSFLDLGGFGGGGIRIISSNGRVLIGSTTDQGAFLLQVNSQIWATNSTIATSDLRLKENVSDLDSSLNLLMGIKPRTFTYKQNTEYNFTEKGVTVGFIAQELKELLQGTSYANSIVVEAGKYYGVAYEKIIPLLVKGIQELKTELDTIKLKNQ